jgi:hypothetical protein
VQLASSTLSGNLATGTAGGAGNGGGLIATSASSALQVLLNASGSTFANNSAAGYGGGLFYDSTHYVSLAGCSLQGNTAVRGGGLFVQPSSAIFAPPSASIIQVLLQSCALSGNAASDSGGGAYVGLSFLGVAGSSFAGNSAAQSGGGLFSQGHDLSVAPLYRKGLMVARGAGRPPEPDAGDGALGGGRRIKLKAAVSLLPYEVGDPGRGTVDCLYCHQLFRADWETGATKDRNLACCSIALASHQNCLRSSRHSALAMYWSYRHRASSRRLSSWTRS